VGWVRGGRGGGGRGGVGLTWSSSSCGPWHGGRGGPRVAVLMLLSLHGPHHGCHGGARCGEVDGASWGMVDRAGRRGVGLMWRGVDVAWGRRGMGGSSSLSLLTLSPTGLGSA